MTTQRGERNEKINIKLSYLKELKRKYTRLLRNPYILNIDREKIIIIIKNKQTNKSISVILLTKINLSFFRSQIFESRRFVFISFILLKLFKFINKFDSIENMFNSIFRFLQFRINNHITMAMIDT